MPWRMVLEIGKAACAAGHQTRVLSGRRDPTEDRWAYGDCPVEEIAKPYSNGTMDTLPADRPPGGIRCPVLAGGVVQRPAAGGLAAQDIHPDRLVRSRRLLSSASGGARRSRIWAYRSALPFLLQSVYPEKASGPEAPESRRESDDHRLRVQPVRRLPGRMARRGRICHPAGKAGGSCVRERGRADRLQRRPEQAWRDARSICSWGRLRGIRGITTTPPGVRPAGAPAAGRVPGLPVPVRSPDRRRRHPQEEWRADPYAERIVCVWQSVGRADLDAFLEACYAVVLPFLLVPSEIPLAIIEAAGHRKPVITTGPGGTADFVREFGLAVPAGHSKALARGDAPAAR